MDNKAYAQALEEHLATLTDEEKAYFTSKSSTPDDILQFAKAMDAERSTRRSTRLTDVFVTTVDKLRGYMDVVESMITAKPELTALIWGGIKIIIQVRERSNRPLLFVLNDGGTACGHISEVF
jgi:hypothetical protein